MKKYEPPSRLSDILSRVFRPRFWAMKYPYNADWDLYVRTSLAMNQIGYCYYGGVENIDFASRHKLRVGEVDVWVSNYPYAYGNPYDKVGSEIELRPSVKTIIALRRAEMQFRIFGKE